MNIIIGHSNMDLDCIGSMVSARYLFPDHVLVRSRLIHPMAANLYNMYKHHLNFLSVRDIQEEALDHVVVVDTRSERRVREYFEDRTMNSVDIEVFDHHDDDNADIEGAEIHTLKTGANTSFFIKRIEQEGLSVSKEDATIALTGIYADTGNFLHENVSGDDFCAASFLLKNGASLTLVNNFIKTLRLDYQQELFHSILNSLVYHKIRGYQIVMSSIELEKQAGGLAEIADKVFEVEQCDALFLLFLFKKQQKVLIIGRSRNEGVPVLDFLRPWGGGGHAAAASALVKRGDAASLYEGLLVALDGNLSEGVKAASIMSDDVHLIKEDWSLLEASLFLEQVNHTGAPVVGEDGRLKGFMTLRDISKGRRLGKMYDPVKGFMTVKLHTCDPDAGLRDIETIFLTHNIGHLPVMQDEQIKGIITRSDFLRALEKS
jgi:tRNA nucleotidyltransferase (CCA-adding enzyme)